MIVPQFWAEAQKQHRDGRKQRTVRRFGWSETSQADAESMAQSRAEDALRRLVAGETIDRRERKVAYNGSTGVPIREEVLSRHGDEVITRNAYGAHCLNTPRALFADIDFEPQVSGKLILIVWGVLFMFAIAAGWLSGQRLVAVGLTLASLFLAATFARALKQLYLTVNGGEVQVALQRLTKFMANKPAWNVRVYQTPAGLRLLATHQPFEATDDEVQAFFRAIAADPVYVRMCVNQGCFRARLTAKPWRIGIADHMRPRPGVWPVQPDRLEIRNVWIKEYEARAKAFAACKYLESIGNGSVHADIRPVVELHDAESKALATGVELA